jgi:hypothetical protein
VLLERLGFDETDLLRTEAGASERLRSVTVTLGELGAPTDPRTVADALVAGFAEQLDLGFTCSVVA